jgi:TatD DNase family protein
MPTVIKAVYGGRQIEAIIDVWCIGGGPAQKYLFREIADSALEEGDRAAKWRGIEYWFVMGESPE